MEKSVWLLAVLVAACAAPLTQSPPAGTPAQIAAPPVQPGNNWTYLTYDGYTHIPKGTVDVRVTRVQGGTITVARTHEGRAWQEHYTTSNGWLDRPLTNLQAFRYQPALPALPFPLHAGKRWREYVQATDPVTGRAYRVRIDGQVLGWERVRVPAGAFDALKVERRIYAGNAGYFRTEERIRELDWYSPQLGAVVRHEGASEYTDTSKSCRYADCGLIRNDWTVLELSAAGRGNGGT